MKILTYAYTVLACLFCVLYNLFTAPFYIVTESYWNTENTIKTFKVEWKSHFFPCPEAAQVSEYQNLDYYSLARNENFDET